jgi:hypothetical protein
MLGYVTDLKHPSNNSANNFITRYWTLNQSGITGGAASVSATYTANDIVGSETSINAARLNGTFNATTNPWFEYSSLGSNTLITTSASLTAGTASFFTGIEGAVTEVTWDGSTSNSWNDASNWTPEAVPTSDMDVTITSGSPIMDVDFTIGSDKTLTISGTGTTLTIAAGKTLTITGNANFGGKSVTLKSDATGTAAIGQVTGSLTGATNVTVERYLQARRKWRALTAPVIGGSNNSIFYNWQNIGTPSGATGAIMWKPAPNTPSTSGLYTGGTSNSLLRFNNGGNSWIAIDDTKAEELFNTTSNKAYMLFFTGPYNITGQYLASGTAASTLRATGTLRSGSPVTFNVGANWTMIGNPYASSVRLNAGTGLNGNAYVWRTDFAGVGGYAPLALTSTSIIESGQAIFVYSASGGSITFAETDKTNSNGTFTVFRSEEPVTNGDLQIELNKTTAGVTELYDVAIVNYKSRAEDGLPKLAQFNENLSIYQNNVDYGMTTRTLNNGEDQIQLRLWQMKEAAYQFKIDLRAMRLPVGSVAVLQDAFLNKETALSTTDLNKIDFNVTSNTASSGQRFRIVFRAGSTTPVTNVEGGEQRFNIYPNPVEKGSAMQLEFRNKLAGKYTVTLFNIAGVQVQQSIVTHGGGNGVQSVAVSSRLASGAYIAEITGANGIKEKMKVVVE